MSFVIRGLGTAVPAMTVSQTEGVAVARTLGGEFADSEMVTAVYEQSGITTRHMVHSRELIADIVAGTRHSQSPYLPGEPGGPSTAIRMDQYAKHAPPLAVQAATQAIAQSSIPASAITHLVTVSCTGFLAPGLDIPLIRELGLRPTVERTHIGFMGCHAAINGLRVAHAFAAAKPDAVVLLTAVELCSLHYYYGGEPGKVVANALFADGAAAVVGTAGVEPWRVAATGSVLLPNSTKEMGWTIGDRGFEMTLTKKIPRLITEHLRPWMERWLAEHGLTVETVGSWAIHPGGPKILTAVEESLMLPAPQLEPSRSVLAAYGNMSSPTVLFILDRLRNADAPRPIVMLGFGPGLVAEAALIR
jgi:predicted naringenin-chalcone synthase